MNQKITFPELVSALAKHTGKQKRVCEDFLKELFATVSASLVAGETVKIKGIGTFKSIAVEPRKSVNINTGEAFEISGHRKVSFTPDRELAAAINSPYDAFQTVVLDDDVTDEDLQQIDEQQEIETQPKHEEKFSDEVSEPTPSATLSSKATERQEESTNIQASSCETPNDNLLYNVKNEEEERLFSSSEPAQPEDNNETQPPEDSEDTAQGEYTYTSATQECVIQDVPATPSAHKGFHRFWHGYWAGLGTAIVFIIIGCAVWALISSDILRNGCNNDSKRQDVPAQLAVADTAQAESPDKDTSTLTKIENPKEELAKTQPSDQQEDAKPVYDTISTTRFLTTMAKDHYGNYHLWPYIYEENKAILGHPDRIRPGTRVVIPPVSKYGIDANNPDCIAKAKRKGVAIYARFDKQQ